MTQESTKTSYLTSLVRTRKLSFSKNRAVFGVQDPKYVKEAFSRIADNYRLTNHVLSFGTDILWRKKVGRIVSEWPHDQVLDVATGT